MRKCSSTNSLFRRAPFCLAVILIMLLALLPAKKLITIETGGLENQFQVAQDANDPAALAGCVCGPLFSEETSYLTPDAAVPFHESLVVHTHSYRGPPVLS